MSAISEIEWLRTVHPDGVVTPGASWNTTRGCDKISPGCKHCYAETFAERWRGIPGHPYELGFDPRLVPSKLGDPLGWKRGRKIFVDSMSDLFHKDFPNEYIAAVFGVMAACPQHTFIMLTKRAERLPDWFDWIAGEGRFLQGEIGEVPPSGSPVPSACAMFVGQQFQKPSDEVLGADGWRSAMKAPWPLPNLWLGVSVEDRERLSRIDELRKVPAAVRVVSFEPLLEDLGPVDLSGIGWGIMGNESGPKCRPGLVPAIQNLLQQHLEQGVPPFVKQVGGNVIDRNDVGFDGASPEEWPTPVRVEASANRDDHQGALVRIRLKNRKGSEPSEWPEQLRVQQWPAVAA